MVPVIARPGPYSETQGLWTIASRTIVHRGSRIGCRSRRDNQEYRFRRIWNVLDPAADLGSTDRRIQIRSLDRWRGADGGALGGLESLWRRSSSHSTGCAGEDLPGAGDGSVLCGNGSATGSMV